MNPQTNVNAGQAERPNPRVRANVTTGTIDEAGALPVDLDAARVAPADDTRAYIEKRAEAQAFQLPTDVKAAEAELARLQQLSKAYGEAHEYLASGNRGARPMTMIRFNFLQSGLPVPATLVPFFLTLFETKSLAEGLIVGVAAAAACGVAHVIGRRELHHGDNPLCILQKFYEATDKTKPTQEAYAELRSDLLDEFARGKRLADAQITVYRRLVDDVHTEAARSEYDHIREDAARRRDRVLSHASFSRLIMSVPELQAEIPAMMAHLQDRGIREAILSGSVVKLFPPQTAGEMHPFDAEVESVAKNHTREAREQKLIDLEGFLFAANVISGNAPLGTPKETSSDS